MRKSTALGLTALVLGSVAVRLSPLWSFLYWGSDTGEYFAILRDLVRTGHISTTYDGWGVTYPYFPGMFFLQGGLAHLSGLDLPTVLNVLVPILGALSVVPIFLIARRVTGEDRVARTFRSWIVYSATFREFTLTDVDIRPWWALLVLFGLGLVFLAGIIYARTRIGWRYRPRYPGLRYRGTAYASAVGVILILGIVSVLFGVPGTTFRVSPEGLLYFVPLVLVISFSAPGRKFLDFDRDGLPVNAWLVVLLVSAIVGIVVAPRVLIPYRHMEYLVVPFAILSGVGFVRLLDLGAVRGRFRVVASMASGLAFVANAFTGVPPPSTLAGWREGTIPAALDPANRPGWRAVGRL